ncbi:Gfo/Idh/MocA family oxidoreductase [Bradyrhizobium sp. 169]|uniref:Gfo/Idh/MocA family oxidoreductase n=1 Tax=Bradyrhizobium sp. 169 TaxID=2782640 RepID=UPI001FF974FA|nr:Gfo/Idh/MocA family oxidoreductase [Bradyrhizobium sp. 169]MCK1590231.1 Gfo/Idh/MocA family oxidoreductase [Bradyrhizobium sp. 169]
MGTEPLRIAVIGAGGNTRQQHIPGLIKQDCVSIVGVANRTIESSREAAKELGLPKAYVDWKEIIADKEVDAVCIRT